MSSLLISLYLFLGLLFLSGGGECLIRGGASFALRMGLPVLVVGLTIMGFGTSMPELVVSLQASLAGKGDISVGNVIGSNIANTGLILGFAALVKPIPVKQQLVQHDSPVMILVSLSFCLLLFLTSYLTFTIGVLLLTALVAYTGWSINLGYREKKVGELIEAEFHPHLLKKPWLDAALILLGFVFLFIGGDLLLRGAVALALRFGVDDAVIAITVVALGTSLPEFATTIAALAKGHDDMALGNIIGSNIFNILAIIGISALIHPIQIIGIHWVDYSYMAILALFLGGAIHYGDAIKRWQGGALLASYAVYIFYLLQRI